MKKSILESPQFWLNAYSEFINSNEVFICISSKTFQEAWGSVNLQFQIHDLFQEFAKNTQLQDFIIPSEYTGFDYSRPLFTLHPEHFNSNNVKQIERDLKKDFLYWAYQRTRYKAVHRSLNLSAIIFIIIIILTVLFVYFINKNLKSEEVKPQPIIQKQDKWYVPIQITV